MLLTPTIPGLDLNHTNQPKQEIIKQSTQSELNKTMKIDPKNPKVVIKKEKSVEIINKATKKLKKQTEELNKTLPKWIWPIVPPILK